jgi:sulfoxide reductase catalytic subunit YedY
MSFSDKIPASEITDEKVYLNRRNFIRAGLLAGSTLATASIYKYFNPSPAIEPNLAQVDNVAKPAEFRVDEKLNSLEEISNYNNFYEFSTDKREVARRAEKEDLSVSMRRSVVNGDPVGRVSA